MRFCKLLLVLCLTSLGSTSGTAQAEPRFSAQFSSGQRLDGAEIHDWHDRAARPRLDGQGLLDVGNPVRWIQDNSLPLAEEPTAFVEFQGGDRLPGTVLSGSTGAESPYVRFPAVVYVSPAIKVDWPGTPRTRGLPVQSRFLRRVVWQRRPDVRLRPSTLFFRDGRQIEFRSIRWGEGVVRVLRDGQTQEVPFSQIAELHFPAVDPWHAWLDQLALLTPITADNQATILQLETADGARLTTSAGRMIPLNVGNNPESWLHAVQPAWALEPLWIGHRTIRMRRLFRPHEVPVTAIEPTRALQRSSLAGGWPAAIDRNVRSGPLRSGGQVFGWGLGVHAYSELEFPVSPLVRGFRSQFGLDRFAGEGGCVRAAVFTGPLSGAPAWQSKVISGSAEVVDTGLLPIAPPAAGSGSSARITLVVDPVINDRPPGADPLEIRDLADWLQPVFELEPSALALELQSRAARAISPWDGWTLSDQTPAVLQNTWDQSDARAPYFRQEIRPLKNLIVLSRRLSVSPDHRFLMVNACRFEKDTAPSLLQVRVNGEAIFEGEIPIRYTYASADPLLVPIDRFQGQSVTVELVQFGDQPQSVVEWQGVNLLRFDPLLVRLFDDEPRLAGALTLGDGLALYQTDDHATGSGALQVTAGERGNPVVADWNFSIKGFARAGEYRFLRFSWKKIGGKAYALQLARNGEFPVGPGREPRDSFRYQVGKPAAGQGPGVQIKDQPAKDWEQVTRDLYSDFGEFTLTGLGLACPDGDAALLDNVYLARREQDFNRIPGTKSPYQDVYGSLSEDQKKTVRAATQDPARFASLLGATARGFALQKLGDSLWLYSSFRDKPNVLRTHPVSQQEAAVFRRPLAVPPTGTTRLLLTVGHHEQADWQLIVKANGEKLYDAIVNAGSAPGGWQEVSVDLSRFAGQTIALEVHNHANDWKSEYAYWARLVVETQ